jgi:methylated-DNA-protein-cysteine methyltransferase-like protein
VAYILHSSSEKERLPWHRVVNSRGMISLKGHGREMQRRMLEHEGVVFDEDGVIDLERFLWSP